MWKPTITAYTMRVVGCTTILKIDGLVSQGKWSRLFSFMCSALWFHWSTCHVLLWHDAYQWWMVDSVIKLTMPRYGLTILVQISFGSRSIATWLLNWESEAQALLNMVDQSTCSAHYKEGIALIGVAQQFGDTSGPCWVIYQTWSGIAWLSGWRAYRVWVSFFGVCKFDFTSFSLFPLSCDFNYAEYMTIVSTLANLQGWRFYWSRQSLKTCHNLNLQILYLACSAEQSKISSEKNLRMITILRRERLVFNESMLANYVTILVWVSEKSQITVWTASSDALLLMSSMICIGHDLHSRQISAHVSGKMSCWKLSLGSRLVFISPVSITLPILIESKRKFECSITEDSSISP